MRWISRMVAAKPQYEFPAVGGAMARSYNLRKRVMVTGGAGFLGSHLIDRLIEKGCDVLCVDNLFTGIFDNIRPLMNHPSFQFIEHDVTMLSHCSSGERHSNAGARVRNRSYIAGTFRQCRCSHGNGVDQCCVFQNSVLVVTRLLPPLFLLPDRRLLRDNTARARSRDGRLCEPPRRACGRRRRYCAGAPPAARRVSL